MSFKYKKSTLDDLLFQLRGPKDSPPDYMVLLGAGASVSSNIPTASGIVIDLLRHVYAHRMALVFEETAKISDNEIYKWSIANLSWFNPDDGNKSEYAQVMENVYQTPGIRARYLKELMRNATPSDGYKYLGMLLRNGIFDTVITTNFDHLIRQATDPLLTIPLTEINALEQYHTLTPYPNEQRVIRLHGDFWHGNVLNTEGELEETPTIRYEAVARLMHSYGLIVLGYSGNDRNIMDQLFEPLTQNHNIGRNGIFWCHRKGAPLSSRVERFLEKSPKGHAYLVEIDDFDSAMAKIGIQFGLKLPSKENLQEQVENLQTQLGIAWDWQALLTQFIHDQLVGLTSAQLKIRLNQLLNLVQSAQAILVRRNPHSSAWSTAAAVNSSLPLGPTAISDALIAKLTANQQSTIRFTPSKAAINDPIFLDFNKDYTLELIVVWHETQLQGFIAFNSPQSIIDLHEVKLVRSAVQLVVMTPEAL